MYDVSTGRPFYGSVGAGYEGFASGADHSRAFLTADFEHNATDDLDNLTHAQLLGVAHWAQFYEDHAKYVYAGVHQGRFFDARGGATAARRAYERSVMAAEAERAAHARRMLASPRCEVAAASGPGRGVWKTMSCDPPLTPRWLILPEHGKLCVCLRHGVVRGSSSTSESGESGQAEPDDPDENEMPHRYRACAASASVCTARTA